MENRIRELRKKRNMTMKQLGEELGLAESTISQYETGKRNADNETLLKMGDFFGVSVGYILGNNDDVIPEALCTLIGNRIVAASGGDAENAKQKLSKFGVRSATSSEMISGNYPFTMATLQQIAEFLGKPVQYFLSDNKKSPALTEKDERDIAKAVERIMGDLENSGNLMFDGVPMSPEAKESMAAAMKLGLEAARLKNKDTYSPKRFRKE